MYYKIIGGTPLHGEIRVSGSKNAALPILAASLLTDAPISLSNVPNISDIHALVNCLSCVGKEITETKKNVLTIKSTNCDTFIIPEAEARKIRGSIVLLGPLMARYQHIVLPLPGGCSIGTRPIDQHILALNTLGVEVVEYEDRIECTRKSKRLQAGTIDFTLRTVTGSENAIMAAVLADGVTTIHNVAREPEVIDLIHFLNKLGAAIVWRNEDSIEITGVEYLSGCEHYSIMGDRIEAGTYLVAAAITRGSIHVRGIAPEFLAPSLEILGESGALIQLDKDGIYLETPMRTLKGFQLVTRPYPGFPTDLQSVFLSFATMVSGESTLCETLFENRFLLVDELRKMGAAVEVNGNTVLVSGGCQLKAAEVVATDLRSGAALVCAALAAQGATLISNIHFIQRGYENLVPKLQSLGANIEEVLPYQPKPALVRQPSFFQELAKRKEETAKVLSLSIYS